MSIENAIADHAAAIRELAAAFVLLAKNTGPAAAAVTTAGVSVAEQEKVMTQVAADRKPSTGKQAIEDALAAAKADKEKTEKEAAAVAAELEQADDGLLGGEDEPANVLDWKADVMPVLQQVGKDKTKLAGLLADFDVGADKTYKTANLLPADVYPQLVAAANKLLGK